MPFLFYVKAPNPGWMQFEPQFLMLMLLLLLLLLLFIRGGNKNNENRETYISWDVPPPSNSHFSAFPLSAASPLHCSMSTYVYMQQNGM